MSKKTRGVSKKEHFAGYSAIANKNRVKRVERHLKKYPEDKQAASALSDGLGYRRKKPTGKGLRFPMLTKKPNGDYIEEFRNVSGRASKPQLKYLKMLSLARKAKNRANYLGKEALEAKNSRIAAFSSLLEKTTATAKAKAKKKTTGKNKV